MAKQEKLIAITGVILLVLWVLMLINVFMETTEKLDNSWKKRLQPFHMDGKGQAVDNNIMLILATTLMEDHGPIAELQRNTMYFLSTMPGIMGVVFVDDKKLYDECKSYHLQCCFDFPKAPFGMPFFFGMLETLMKLYPNYPFYGYINGDILVENTVLDVLKQLQKDMKLGKIGEKVSVFTHRKNMFASFPDDLYSQHSESRDELFNKFNLRSVTYWDVAIDMFIFTPAVFPWRLMPNFVIGRTKYDNFIIQSISRDPSQVMVDASNTVAIIHQTVDGVRSGLRKQRSEKKSSINMLWNELVLHVSGIDDCCQDIWFAEHASHVVVPLLVGICVQDKRTRSYMEDDFQTNEIEVLKQYIKSEDKRRCLFVVEGAITGFMNHICEHSYYLCTNRQQCLLSRKRIIDCGLQDTVTVICTEITRDKYMQQLVEYLQYYNARFDTVISMLPSGDGLIQFIILYQKKFPPSSNNMKLYFIRGFNRVQTRNSVLLNADVDIINIVQYKYYFDGPHFPELGMAVYCEKGKASRV